MRFLFTDDAFAFEALRVTGYAAYGGADLGEVIVTARQIPDGDEAARTPSMILSERVRETFAAAATRRGYNCIAFDGPGQGAVLRDQGLTFRPDWETVVSAVIDAALERPEVDPDRIALMGTSLGGFLAARAAAFEHRLAALILHDAIFDIRSGLRSLPPELLDLATDGKDEDSHKASRRSPDRAPSCAGSCATAPGRSGPRQPAH
jgi:alpha-beta hydrolase superfamily lysophospholipase